MSIPIRTLEYLLGALSVLWGAVLIWPGETYATSQSFRILAETPWTPEAGVGALFVFFGLLRVWAAWRGSLRVRTWLAAEGMFKWVFVALMFALGSFASTGWVVYTFVSVVSAYVLDALREARAVEQRNGNGGGSRNGDKGEGQQS